MLGIFLIYFIGKKFYEIAQEYNKNKWLFTILGIVSYYFGTFVCGIILTLNSEIYGTTSVDEMNKIALTIIAAISGLLSVVIFYFILKKIWDRKKE